MRYAFFLLAALFISSCGKKDVNSMADLFENKFESVSVENFSGLETDSVRAPYMMSCLENELLFADMHQNSIISSFDKYTGSWLRYSLQRGNGPDEYLHFSNMQAVDGKLFLWDSGKSVMNMFALENDSFTIRKHIPIVSDSCMVAAFQVTPIDTSHFVAAGIIKGNRLAMLDSAGKVCCTFGDYPFSEEQGKDDVSLAFANQGNVACQSLGNRFAISNMMGESLVFFDVSDCYHPRSYKEYNYISPTYQRLDDGSVVYDQNCKVGFVALAGSKDYCIGLFNGDATLTSPNYGGDKLLFFDWEGNPIKAIKLDWIYSCLAVDEEAGRIFLLGNDSKTLGYRVDVLDF